jgi:hypothetical protein
MKKILIQLLTCINIISSAGAMETESPHQIYKDLLADAQLAIESYETDQIDYKKAVAKEEAEKARAQSSTGSDGGGYCRSAPLYSSLHTFKELNYHVKQDIEKLQSINDQAVFAAYNAQWGPIACQDYRAENIQQFKKTLLREFSQACEALERSLLGERAFIPKAKEHEIKEKAEDCLELLRRIERFAEYGFKAHELQTSKM